MQADVVRHVDVTPVDMFLRPRGAAGGPFQHTCVNVSLLPAAHGAADSGGVETGAADCLAANLHATRSDIYC